MPPGAGTRTTPAPLRPTSEGHHAGRTGPAEHELGAPGSKPAPWPGTMPRGAPHPPRRAHREDTRGRGSGVAAGLERHPAGVRWSRRAHEGLQGGERGGSQPTDLPTPPKGPDIAHTIHCLAAPEWRCAIRGWQGGRSHTHGRCVAMPGASAHAQGGRCTRSEGRGGPPCMSRHALAASIRGPPQAQRGATRCGPAASRPYREREGPPKWRRRPRDQGLGGGRTADRQPARV